MEKWGFFSILWIYILLRRGSEGFKWKTFKCKKISFLLTKTKWISTITCSYILLSRSESLYQYQVNSYRNQSMLKLFSYKEPALRYGNKFVIDVSHGLQACTHESLYIVHFIIYTFCKLFHEYWCYLNSSTLVSFSFENISSHTKLRLLIVLMHIIKCFHD